VNNNAEPTPANITDRPLSRQSIRLQMRARRNSLTDSEQTLAAQRLCQRLSQHPAIQHANHIAAYLANDRELSLHPFIEWCWQQHKQVYLPVLHPFCTGYLIFIENLPTSDMRANRFGILEPKSTVSHLCPLNQLNTILTPLVAFDRYGARLGMGGGFYDRTLANWFNHQQSSKLNTLKVMGIAHDCQQVEAIPTQLWDIPLPEIITPSQSFSY